MKRKITGWRLLLPVLSLIGILLANTSCVQRKQLVYARVKTEAGRLASQDTLMPVNPLIRQTYRVQPGNYLMVQFTSRDAAFSELVNGKAMEFQQTDVESTVYYKSYPVNHQGNIHLYLLGDFQVSGMTTAEIAARLEAYYSKYVKDPSVKVHLANHRIFVLGEVRNPGVKLVYDEKVTIFQALALAGDLTMFGRRDRVRIIRESPLGMRVITVDLSAPETLSSEHYYLVPGDIVYVEPARARAADQNRGWIQVLLSGLSVTLLAINILSQ
ncbi:MAG: polysaccharide biosynthesis/export family protein [Salibacteraceae bacterium]